MTLPWPCATLFVCLALVLSLYGGPLSLCDTVQRSLLSQESILPFSIHTACQNVQKTIENQSRVVQLSLHALELTIHL